MTGAEILARVEGHITDGELRLESGSDLDSPDVDRLLDAFFGGALVAVTGPAEVRDTEVVYANATLYTAGFALYGGAETVPAALAFRDPGDGTIQLAVDADMPTGYGLADSFPVLASRAPVGALVLSRAAFTLDSTYEADTVRFTSVAPTTQGLLAPVAWMFPSEPTLDGDIVVTRSPAGVAFPGMDLRSETMAAPAVSGFGLSMVLTAWSQPVESEVEGEEPWLLAAVELKAELEVPGLPLPVVLTLREDAKSLPMRLDTLAPAPSISSLSQLSGLTGGEDPSGAISADTPIGELSIDWASLVLDLETGEIRDVQMTIGLGTDWTVVDRLVLKRLQAVFGIANPRDAESVTATVTAEIEAGPARIDASVFYPDNEVLAQLAPGSAVDVEDFMRLFAPGATLPGRSDFVITTFSLRADIDDGTYALASEAEGQLEILPTFVVDRLSFEVEYGAGALQQLAFGCLFEIAGTELYLATTGTGDTWVLSGGLYDGSRVNLSDVVRDIASIFGVVLPDGLPEIVLSDLEMPRYDTADGSFAFEAQVDYVADDDPLLKSVTGRVEIGAGAVDAATGEQPWTGRLTGAVLIGESLFTVLYDFHENEALTCSWQAEGEETFGIESLCEMLGLPSPGIPEGLDLGLTRVEFTYDLTAGSVLLAADSANYGKAVFVTQTFDGETGYAFGVEVPIFVRLSDIPLVGEKIPDADQLGIRDMGVWILTQPLTKAQAAAVNAALAALDGYPTLPERDLDTTVTLFGTLQLGRDAAPLDLPLGTSASPEPTDVEPTDVEPEDVEPETAVCEQQAKPEAPSAGSAVAPAAVAAADSAAAAAPEAGPPAGAEPPAGEDGTCWFDVQKTFGVFSFRRVGIRYESEGGALFVVLDASIAMGPLTFSLDGLAVGTPLTKFEPTFHLSGLGLGYARPPLEITGALLAVPGQQLAPSTAYRYDGVAVAKSANYTVSGVGSYAQLESGDPSLFVFAQLESPLGGPPAFFVTGLMGGFGFNRSLALPARDEVQDFPLLALASPPEPGRPAPSQDPMAVLDVLEGRAPLEPGGTPRRWIEPSPGDTWLAVGLSFTSFELVRSKALLIAELGDDLRFSLLGISTVQLPVPAEGAASYAYAEMQLDAVFRPADGFFGLAAQLTDRSYVLTPECTLTGGFSFFAWFGESEHAGQFVVTLGGYHPAFRPPAYYPTQPRLGFNWPVSGKVTIKGDAYLALTPSCAMAGGSLETVYHDGGLRAWFTARADLLISWRPFFFDAEIEVNVGASYRLNLGVCHKTIKASVGATVELWGPPTGGKVRIHLSVVSFTVRFGSRGASAKDDPLPWTDFASLLPHPNDVCRIAASDGLRGTVAREASGGKAWIVGARRFRFTTQSAIPAGRLRYGDAAADAAVADALAVDDGDGTVDVRPMDRRGVTSTHRLWIFRGEDATQAIDVSGWTIVPRRGAVPAALWGEPPSPFTQIPKRPTAEVLPDRLVGYDVTAPEPVLGATLGIVPGGTLAVAYLSPEGRAPIAADAAPSPDFVPRYEATSVAAVAGIAGAEATAARDALYATLAAAGVYDGANGSVDVLAREAGHLYSDPPMVQR
ncbi:MAG TPA: DUF6603 domain-containing protein [Longimicrobiales bacterium]